MSEFLHIVINGDQREVPSGFNVAELLNFLSISAQRVAIERNMDILPRLEWDRTPVLQGDRFEIVQLVGGG